MGNNKKLSVDSTDIMKASNALANAEKYIASAKSEIDGMGIRAISGPGMSPAGIMANIKENVSTILSNESELLTQLSKDLKHNANQLSNVDKKSNGISGIAETERQKGLALLERLKENTKNSNNNGSSKYNYIGVIRSDSDESSKKSNSKKKKKKKKEETGVTKSAIRTIIPVPPIIDTNSIVDAIVNIIHKELDKLDNYIKNGDLTSATKIYEFLKVFGYEDSAESIINKYGYKVEEKDGKYVISKITEENPNPASETDTNTDNSSPSENITSNIDNDVIAEETVNPETEQNSTEAIVDNQENNQNKTETVVNPTNTSNSNYSSSNSSNQHVVENTSTDVNNADTATQVETDTATIDSTTDIEDSIKENTKDTSKSNVVSITDDTETTTAKKTSGLGTAIPIGLGTIAAGAAAVAGVRYVKNRHDNQEEYDESYDDENNNLDENEEYVDSAQYDDGSSYMDDDYLGSADNNNSSEDSYVDPSDLEDIEDSVLEDLNSNY